MTKTVILLNNNPPFAGTGRYAYMLHRSLTRLNMKVVFITWDKELFNSIYQSLRAFRLEWIYYLWKFKYLSAKLKINSSLVHITNAGYLVSVVPSLKRKAVSKIVITVHDLIPFIIPRSIATFHVQNKMFSIINTDYIITVSENTKKDLLHFIGVDPRKVKVVYNGVDHELFKPRDKFEARRRLGLPLDRPIILNVGSEEPRKNIPILLNSFKELLNSNPNALLVRVGKRTAQIEKLIRKLDLSGEVLYCRASQDELALYYNAADLLCFPSYYEGFGNPPLEAMASGLPVIASNRASIPEVVGDAGILLDPFDVEGFAYWMYEMLTNEDLRARFYETGYKRSLNFSWEKCARETLEVYNKVLNEV